MELERYNEETHTWDIVEVQDEETQLIYDTMLAEMEVQEVMELMEEQNGTD
jgi:hypothetical protein